MLLKKGSRGPDVRELQEALGLAADGIFGSGTEAAVKKFQKENDLAVDGLVGRGTWEMLGLDTDESGWNAATDKDDKLERLGKYKTKDGLEIDRAYLDGDEFVSILSKFTKIPEKERTPQLLG